MKVSVIIPTFNRSDMLCECMQSVLASTHKDIEAIVTDDCSSEDIRGALRKRFGDDSRIKYTRTPFNGFTALARNCGARISDYSGSAIAFYLQGKPVIHYAYDYDFYTTKDTGLIADLNAIRFGVIAKSINELCNAIDNLQSATNQCGQLAQSLIEYENGHSCEKYEKFIHERVFAK